MAKVDLLGLNAFGRNPGMNPLLGTLIGGGVAGGTSLVLKKMGKANPDLMGFVAGVVSAGVLYSMKKARHAAFGAVAGAFFASGLSWIAGKFLTNAAAAQAVAGMGIPQIQYLNGANLGIPQVQYLNGAGMGLPGLAPVPPAYGTIPGVAGPGFGGAAPVDLLGPGTAQSSQISLLGGPTISGLSSAYGATLLGGGRN